MPSILHTGLTVRDLDRSLAFYRDLLGMELVFTQEKRGGYLAEIVGYPGAHVRMAHLAFPGDAQRIELFEYLEPASSGEAAEPRQVGLTHVCLRVDDIGAVHDRLLAAGVRMRSAPVLVDTGANAGGRGLYVHDPDGALVELFQPPPAKPPEEAT
jgi:catechol 2,3-dioxygenase-like lactoylglutathione lyase family enzyme